MKLIAEIEAAGGSLRLSYDGLMLTVGDAVVGLAEFRDALNAVAPLSGRQKQRVEITGDPPFLSLMGSAGEAKPPTRAADGSRIGPSPRYAMRAVKPEANVEELEDDGETAA